MSRMYPVRLAAATCAAVCLLTLSGCTTGGSNASSGSNTGSGTWAQTIAPTITQQPVDKVARVGETAAFTVAATGTAPLLYEWRRNGAAIAGAASAAYTTGTLTAADDGAAFTVVVSNTAGSVVSSSAKLSVGAALPSIATQPQAQTRFVGETATFTVAAAGGALSYQWRVNGAAISGATASTYTSPALTFANDKGAYDVTVSNSAGTVTSAAATLSVGPFAYAYTSQKGTKMSLYAWPGSKTALLTSSPSLDPAVMRKYLLALDGTYNYYSGTVGKQPPLLLSYNGLATTAEIPSAPETACGGAGCTYLGATGMEIAQPYFNWMLFSIPNNAYDQIPFYEMGRSFWLFPQINFFNGYNNSCLNTGFAVLMRSRSLSSLGYQGSFNSFATSAVDTANNANGAANYNRIVVTAEGLIDSYAANTALTFENTFLVDKYTSPNGSCADLFSSLIRRLARDYGDEAFIQALWKEVLKRPASTTNADASDNFVLAASAAANKNLTVLFHDQWRWPVSVSATNEALSRWGKP